MRKLTFIFLFFCSISYGQTFYASSSGSGTTCSSGSPCSLSYAYSNASAGETWYIDSASYGDTSFSVNVSGTSENPIKFIGYTTTAGDIDEDAQTTYTLGTQTINVMTAFSYGDSVNSSVMPLFTKSGNTGTHLVVNGSYLHFYNMQFSLGDTAIRIVGDNNVFKNIVAVDQGNQTSATYSGKGITNFGDNNTFKNIYIENAGAQGLTIQGVGGIYDGISAVCDNTGNPTDYYFLFQEGNNNLATNIYVRRVGGLSHYGHGIVYKTASPCYNNNVDGFIINNTCLEIQFPGVHDNEVKNGYIEYQPDSYTPQNIEGITLANGSYNNTLQNIYSKDGPLAFTDWKDGLTGDVADMSDGNIFNQITIDLREKTGSGDIAIRFNYGDAHRNGGWTSSADNNTFYNCTFYNAPYLFENSRPNTNTTFINCLFDTFPSESIALAGSVGYALNINYNNCNFSNLGFSTPTGTDITTLSPNFVDALNGNFTVQNSSLLGAGVATPFLSDGNDIGSFQTGSTPPPPATCSDGIQNGDETGVDCGGSCPNSCVVDNSPPTALHFQSTGSRVIHIDEGTSVQSFTLTTVDPDVGDTFTYTKEIDNDASNGGPDPSFFSISGDQLTFTYGGDYDTPEDSNQNNIYALNVRTTDSEGNYYIEDMVIYVDDTGGTDVTAPSVTNRWASALENSFSTGWTLDEGSKGYVRYGTSTGVYTDSTTVEERYLLYHVQEPTGLTPSTTYYYQYYVEDVSGNTGYSSEYTTTTAAEGSTPTFDSLMGDLRALFLKAKKF